MNRTQMVIGFGLYGPMWGGLALMGFTWFWTMQRGNRHEWMRQQSLMGLPLYMFFSYLYGLLPALITGAVLSMYRDARGLSFGGWQREPAQEPWLVFNWMRRASLDDGFENIGFALSRLYLGGASAFSAMCCALLYRPLAEPQ